MIWPLDASRQSKVIVSPEATCIAGGMLEENAGSQLRAWTSIWLRHSGTDLLSQARWHWERLTAWMDILRCADQSTSLV